MSTKYSSLNRLSGYPRYDHSPQRATFSIFKIFESSSYHSGLKIKRNQKIQYSKWHDCCENINDIWITGSSGISTVYIFVLCWDWKYCCKTYRQETQTDGRTCDKYNSSPLTFSSLILTLMNMEPICNNTNSIPTTQLFQAIIVSLTVTGSWRVNNWVVGTGWSNS